MKISAVFVTINFWAEEENQFYFNLNPDKLPSTT